MNRERVDVRTQHHCLTRPAGIENRNHAGLGWTWLQLKAQLAKALADPIAGLVLTEAHLGVTVEVTAQLDHFFDDGVGWDG